jgi:alkylation response protein AidB-like acyl-CoA dehydrogenase
MDFRLTEAQGEISEALRSFLAGECTPARRRALLQSGATSDPDRWAGLGGLGFLACLVPEALGGLGLAEIDLVGLAQACGAACLPEPLVAQAGVVAPLLADLGAEALLARLLAGEVVALAHPDQARVPDADMAAEILLMRDGSLYSVPAGSLRVRHFVTVDPFHPLHEVAWEAGQGTELARGSQVSRALDRAFERGALFAAAEMLGIAEQCLALAGAYALERRQFGKLIGTNQAIKHMLANVAVQIEFARPVLWAAAAGLDGGAARISHAKLAAGTAAEAAARAALQVHGAMGYSWEVDVHFYLKRALFLNNLWGTAAFHRARLLRHVRGTNPGPGEVFARDPVTSEVSHG